MKRIPSVGFFASPNQLHFSHSAVETSNYRFCMIHRFLLTALIFLTGYQISWLELQALIHELFLQIFLIFLNHLL